MKVLKPFIFMGILLLFALLVSACAANLTNGALSDADVLLTAQAANPLPTQLANQGLVVVTPQACTVSTLVSVQTSPDTGDFIAWSPTGDLLAYITPDNEKWGWFVGNLVILDVKTQKPIYTSENQKVAGDLTWSPNGERIAYIVLDQQSKTYSIHVLDLSSTVVQEVFSGTSAQTDSWSSPKGIENWQDSNTLLVTSSCDVDCSRRYSFDVTSGSITALEETRKKDNKALLITDQYLSPDSRWQIVIDINDNVWLSSSVNKQVAVISSGTTINEIKWSEDSAYVALRTDESVLIYQPNCGQ